MGCMGSTPIQGKLKIILISGSLRQASTNTGLLRACVEANHPNLEFEWAHINDFPVFSEDIQAKGTPKEVQRVKDQIKKANGILFGVPQNNYAPSAALKNAYDWLSRGDDSVLINMPVAMVSSGGDQGGLRAQTALRKIGEYRKVQFMKGSEIAVKRYNGSFFDDKGNVTDAGVKKQIASFLDEFAHFVNDHKKK